MIQRSGSEFIIVTGDATPQRVRALRFGAHHWRSLRPLYATPTDDEQPDPDPEPGGDSLIWPFPESSVTSEYGPRPGIGKGYHDGIDFGQPDGTPIPAIADGIVTDTWIHSDSGPYSIDIDHGNGFHSQYWHNSAKYVSAGQSVLQGEIIGAVGNLGLSFGAHLHLEVHYPGSPSGRSTWDWRLFYDLYQDGGW